MIATYLREFTDDPTVLAIVVLVALDFVLGICASIVAHTFRAGWLADFLRRDILAKLIPYFAVWFAVRVGGDIKIDGYGLVEETVGLAVTAAIGASVLNSLRDLGLIKAPDAIAGSDEPPPTP